uniref:Uncharacterized protein n=1 Tax=Quercus lobata TaxID=97700 RepID=A0A7N2MKP7_QUELO
MGQNLIRGGIEGLLFWFAFRYEIFHPFHLIISDGKLKATEHRVVKNSNLAWTIAAFALDPFNETLIEPAKALVDTNNPALYKSLSYKDFLIKYRAAASYSTTFESF